MTNLNFSTGNEQDLSLKIVLPEGDAGHISELAMTSVQAESHEKAAEKLEGSRALIDMMKEGIERQRSRGLIH